MKYRVLSASLPAVKSDADGFREDSKRLAVATVGVFLEDLESLPIVRTYKVRGESGADEWRQSKGAELPGPAKLRAFGSVLESNKGVPYFASDVLDLPWDLRKAIARDVLAMVSAAKAENAPGVSTGGKGDDPGETPF